jgi:tetratricopeptide (TPR) repeat protein
MAASATNISPSNKPVQEEAVKATVSFDGDYPDATAPMDDKTDFPSVITEMAGTHQPEPTSSAKKSVPTPTYIDSENSEWYITGKKLLGDGDFEAALMTIEEGIEATKEMILKFREKEQIPNNDDDFVLHESMAPLHYLYGTTLLYSIEESDDNQAMTVGGQPPVDTNVDEDEDPEINTTGEEESRNEETNEFQTENQDSSPVEDPTEDIQIAWENLELARSITEATLLQNPDNLDPSFQMKLKLDLAQIYLREGDLQRINSKYEDSISDYKKSLQLLQENGCSQNERKIADVHYNLGLTYFMLTASCNTSNTDEHAIDNNSSPEESHTSDSPEVIREKIAIARSHGFYHYVACAMTFGSVLAHYCNIDPKKFISTTLQGIPNLKMSGDDPDESEMEDPKVASTKVCSLRQHLKSLSPVLEFEEQFHALQELLDEIQETIDEAESSEQGVQEVSAMKEEIANAVAGQTELNAGDVPFATNAIASTTIGFDNPVNSAWQSATSATIGTTTTTTILQVRKKTKKRDASQDEIGIDDKFSKRPRSE